ncbi:MAG: Holliday junction DNA helicase RuvA [Deltaproteobacteria bacterium RIFCSPLOWO2_12_FULL_60_16]|nr:MAG: Holliday junction DNA helicase RuvA [Deltaproteobacteria bacterium RIFCSPLOWO2_12_FULL_60_16]
MIAKISGTLEHKVPGEVIVDVAGVGYQILIPLNVFYRLPEVGGTISLHIHTHLREDALQLFGFMEQEEKHIFLLLNGVAGIGPKLAINILSGIPVEELARALKEGDHLKLLSIPGVGKKLAERMIVELRDKMLRVPSAETGRADGSQLTRDAVSALVNLGYRQGEAERSVREVARQGETTLAEVLKEALRRLSQ